MVTSRIAIESIAAGGDGVGRADGMAVFVPRTAPGDVVDATLDVEGRFARGRIVSLVEPSADRVEPPCVHYTRDRCGGCQLQHVEYDAQLRGQGDASYAMRCNASASGVSTPSSLGRARRRGVIERS